MRRLALPSILVLLALAHGATHVPSEPHFKYDESRHVMTGVFFRDLFTDLPFDGLVDYVTRYYMQYPALGLIVWPPLFYAIEGFHMLFFGTSVAAGKALVVLFAALACLYLYLIACRTHGRFTALLAAAVFGISPLVFTYSRHIMLEVPTAAFALAATYHALRYLDTGARSQVILAALAAASCALTRFDGVFLLPLLLILVASRGRLDVLWRKEVWGAALLGLALAAPFYAITASQFGWMHWKAVDTGTFAGSARFMAPGNFLYYPRQLPHQLGWTAVGFAAAGLAAGLSRDRRPSSWPYLATILAAYFFFSPMAELDPRHTIYWVGAFALFAADGVSRVSGWLGRPGLRPLLAGLLCVGTGWASLSVPAGYLRGFEEAARYVAENMEGSRSCLIDCYYDANFIYQLRRVDPERKRWVLRGDKVLYGTLGDPHAGYVELVKDDQELLDRIYRLDPALIVVEEPRPYHDLPMATRLREALRRESGRFRLERTFPVEGNYRGPRGMQLLVYRNLLRNPRPESSLTLEMLGLRRSITTTLR